MHLRVNNSKCCLNVEQITLSYYIEMGLQFMHHVETLLKGVEPDSIPFITAQRENKLFYGKSENSPFPRTVGRQFNLSLIMKQNSGMWKVCRVNLR